MSIADSIRRFDEPEPSLQTINPVLAEVVYKREVVDDQGHKRPLVADISRQEGLFLRHLILSDPSIRSVVEIGCAMGISSLFMASALAGRKDPKHVVIDPDQHTYWKDAGVRNLRRAGFDFCELIAAPSEFALPTLNQQGRVFDMAYVDGMHTFDHCLLDFFYLNRLVRVGGLVVFDDCDFNPINKMIRYISNYPHWQIVACSGDRWISGRRKIVELLKKLIHPFSRLLPRRAAAEFFDDSVIRLDRDLGLNTSMIAMKKMSEDPRSIEWYVKF